MAKVFLTCERQYLYQLSDNMWVIYELISLILSHILYIVPHTLNFYLNYSTAQYCYCFSSNFYRSPTYSNLAVSHYYPAMQANNIPSAAIKVSSYYPRREKYWMQANGHHYWALLPGKHNTSFLFWLTLMIGFFLMPWQPCQLQLLWRWDPPQAK